MATDGTTIAPMSGGDTIDTEYISARSAKLQRIKIVTGALDTDSGDVSLTNPLPIGGTIPNGSTDSGNPVKIGGVYNSSVPTLTTGQRADAQADVNANLKTTLATLLAGEDLPNNVLKVEQRFTPTQITSSTVVKNQPGRLAGLFVSAASSTPTVTIYDNTAGTSNLIIGTFTPLAGTLYTFPTHIYANGINIVLGGTVSCTAFWI